MSGNPIAEASTTSLDQYFSADPNSLSDQDLDIVVEELRRMRVAWETDQPAKKPRATKAKAVMLSAEDLEDL